MKFLRSFCFVAFLASVSACSSSASSVEPTGAGSQSDVVVKSKQLERARLVSVIGTNDLHGHIEMLPILAGYLDILRSDPNRAVILIDGGDMFQGTLASNLVEGAPIVTAYELLGYHAVTIGNHEFDFGPEGADTTVQHEGQDARGALKARAAEADFPFLSSNVLEDPGGNPIAWPNVRASTLVEVKGIQVGIIGVTTFETPHVTLSANFAGLRMAPLVETIAGEARTLRASGADIVLVAAHAGGICTDLDKPHELESCDQEQEIFQVARALPAGSVDGIVAGHTHQGVAHEVAGIPIIESFAHGRAFGRIDFTTDSRGSLHLERIHPPRQLCLDEAKPGCDAGDYEGQSVRVNAQVAAIAEEAEKLAADIRSKELGIDLSAPVLRSRSDASALGNLFADLMLAAQPSAQVAITNGGSLRADLPAGPLLYGSLFEAMPFDNRFAVVSLTAADLATLIGKNLQRDSGILSISGIRARARCKNRELEVYLTSEKGRRILPSQTLVVATSDFLASGGDGLFDGESVQVDMSDSRLIRDAMAEELRRRGGALDASEKKLFDPARPRIEFEGTRPLRCR